MMSRRGLFLALAACTVVGACAPAATTEGTGAAGTRPTETRFTTQAKLQIAQAESAEGEAARALYQQALQASLQGIESAPANPQHYYLAGLAYAGLDDFEAADTMWNRALEMWPGYRGDIAVAREQAWAQAFNAGVEAYNAGNVQEAIRHWERANQIFQGRPEAYFNLAAVYTQEQQYDQAIEAFQASVAALDEQPERELSEEERAEREEARISALQNLGNLQLFRERFADAERTYRRLVELQPQNVQAQSALAVALARQGRQDEAMQVYQRLLAMPNLSAEEMMSVGVGLFQAEQYEQAAQAFRRITELQPNNRDAWYNYLNALYAQQRYQELTPVGERLLELDPLNENAHLILIQAFRETRQQQRALTYAERNQANPIHVDELQLTHDNGRATLRGQATGNQARAGSPVRLEFTFYGADNQPLGTQTVTVTAPARGESTQFQVSLNAATPPTGFRYRVVQ